MRWVGYGFGLGMANLSEASAIQRPSDEGKWDNPEKIKSAKDSV
jgi:hypothetical protein